LSEVTNSNIASCYGLQLADGQEWNIIAAGRTKQWVEKLTRIMELRSQPMNGSPKLIFTSERSSEIDGNDPTTGLDPDLRMSIPDHDWLLLDFHLLKLWVHSDVPDMIYEIDHEGEHELTTVRMWFALLPVYERIMRTGGIPLHAALIEKDGQGFILSGSGSSGKTTCCNRLPSPWRALCDDEILVAYSDRQQYTAHPFPTWSDYLWRRSERTWNVERNIPVSAIFFLQQSDVDEATRIGAGEAAIRINRSALQVFDKGWRKLDPEAAELRRKKLFKNSCLIAKHIPAFTLKVKPDGRFWDELEKVNMYAT